MHRHLAVVLRLGYRKDRLLQFFFRMAPFHLPIEAMACVCGTRSPARLAPPHVNTCTLNLVRTKTTRVQQSGEFHIIPRKRMQHADHTSSLGLLS